MDVYVNRATSKGEDKTDFENGNAPTEDTAAVSRIRETTASRHVVQRWRFARRESTSSVQSQQVSSYLSE